LKYDGRPFFSDKLKEEIVKIKWKTQKKE
jgi:hypothetical protein